MLVLAIKPNKEKNICMTKISFYSYVHACQFYMLHVKDKTHVLLIGQMQAGNGFISQYDTSML